LASSDQNGLQIHELTGAVPLDREIVISLLDKVQNNPRASLSSGGEPVTARRLPDSVMTGEASAIVITGEDNSIDSMLDALNRLLENRRRYLDKPQTIGIAEDFKGWFRDAPVASIIADQDGTILEANTALAERFDIAPDALTGQKVEKLLSDTERHLRKTEGEPVDFDVDTPVEFSREDGETFFAEITSFEGSDGQLLYTLRSVDDQRQDKRRLQTNDKTLEKFHNIISDRETSFDDKVSELLELGRHRLQLPIAFLTRIEDGEQHILAAAGDHELIQPGASAPLTEAYCRRTIRKEDTLTVNNVSEDPDWIGDPAYEAFKLECYAGAPLEVNGETFGTFCFASKHSRDSDFDSSEETFLGLFSAWLSQELEKQQNTRQLETTLERTRRVIDVVPWIVFVRSETDKLLVANQESAEALNSNIEDVEGEPFDQITAMSQSENREIFSIDTSLLGSDHSKVETEKPVETESGDIRYIDKRQIPMSHIPSGENAVLAVVDDRTQSVRSRRTLEKFFDISLDFLCVFTPGLEPIKVSDNFTTDLGYDEAELLSDSLEPLIHPDDLDTTRQQIDAVLSGTAVKRFKNRIRDKEGLYREISWSAAADPTESIIYAAGRDLSIEEHLSDD
jgi:PAS domain S-box-containing protein